MMYKLKRFVFEKPLYDNTFILLEVYVYIDFCDVMKINCTKFLIHKKKNLR